MTDRELMDRRKFLSRMWTWGGGLIAAAGAWTTWDLFKPALGSGLGGLVRSVPADQVPEKGVVEVTAARSYLTRINGEIVALAEKCTHLGCRTPWCEASGQFECPCHGSVFNRAGEYRAGPAPRGLDRHPVEVQEDGLVYIDTSTLVSGAPPGDESIDEPPAGGSCEGEGH